MQIPRTGQETVPTPTAVAVQTIAPIMGVGIQTTEAEPIETMIELPIHLRIPSIAVNAAVEEMGVRPDGKLDAPKRREDAGWYKLGARPGEEGTSVIDGHLDLAGKPGVFWHLKKMQTGDLIYVTDDIGTERAFRVTETVTYHVSDAPLRDIFARPGGKRLHLITCAGVWREELNHYDQRLVVYAEMVELAP
jgi:LPXTG-site transpeptidase (sortase) family protein